MINKLFKADWVLLGAVFLLLGIGLAVLYSISNVGEDSFFSSVFWKQVFYAFLAVSTMLFFSLANYHYLRSYSTSIYFATLLILVVVLVFGETVRGTSGWIGFGAFNVQPVEIAKITLVIFLASFISQKRMELGEVGRLIASFVLTGIMLFLVIKQPDFGSAMVLLSVWAGMIFVSGISRKLIFMIVFVAAAVSFVGWFQLAPYQKDRIASFVDPTRDPQGAGYNVRQSIVAVGSGGMIGKGIGHGSQSQLNFLPEKHTDFIFASIAEELGYLGSIFVIALFGTIFYRIRRIAQLAPDNFGYLVAVGILIMFFVQTFINIGMNMGIVPVTGIPLPFLSYGGSSLISVFAAVGILVNIYSRRESAIKTEF
ncbi:MAG TPA: rod shape-determining protein RodA [Candidatus Moranbacteria bacterium]|nr:MAG: hypothetical protein UW87_C0032G0003 [Candidatus Moranbacteria bacterium GW2011_GWC2_45_10]KKT94663.1 MAG: hypothetical protein UW95_C0011G0020 [Parcubacteria group bacterium GW2011_GWC1_45_14]HAV10931.1 rod shape-determining protein RodA [Candidatus Moranbacteria bacterium]